MTDDLAVARKWFHMGVGLDGIVAKREDLPYQTGERTGMQKIKKQRTADCVVGGFRYLEKKRWSVRCCWGFTTTRVAGSRRVQSSIQR